MISGPTIDGAELLMRRSSKVGFASRRAKGSSRTALLALGPCSTMMGEVQERIGQEFCELEWSETCIIRVSSPKLGPRGGTLRAERVRGTKVMYLSSGV